MKIELTEEQRTEAVHSLQRYFERNMPEPLGTLPAGQLLDFFLQEFGPPAYNRAIADVQARLQQRLSDLEGELYAEEFPFWKGSGVRRGR